MSVKLYDDALLAKLKNWTAGTQLYVTGVNETKRLFEVLSDKNNDNPLKLPIIALSRSGGYTLLNKNKRPLTFDGSTVALSTQAGAKLNAIPISISYQIDVYTRYLEEADEYARNLVFNIINYPKFTVEIPYEDLHLLHDANIRLASDVEDNSDIPERLAPGQFTRFTMNLTVDDAYLFDVRIKNNISIVELDIMTDDNSIREIIK